MTIRRRFLQTLGGAAAGTLACAGHKPSRETEDALGDALRELNEAAGIGITEEDFGAARAYAAGAYRDVASKLRPIVLDESLDLPVAFRARRSEA